MKSMVLPTSVMIPIPAGPPVLIGGSPTISLMALGMRFGMAALGKGLKRLAKTKLARKIGKAFKAAKKKAFRNMKPGFVKCKVLKAEPVDVVTGEVVVDQQDFSIPGRIPIEWNRHYGSQSERMGVCGYGWETPADARLEFDYDGTVIFHDGTGAPSYFDSLPTEGPVQEPVDGGTLHQIKNYYVVRLKDGLHYYFPIPKEPVEEILVEYVTDLCKNYVKYVRNENGLNEIVESEGRSIDVTSVNGLIQEMRLRHPGSSPAHPFVRFEYSESGDLVCVYDALNAPYQFSYKNHGLIQHTDRNKLSFYYDYDEYCSDGRCVHAWGDGGLYNYHFKFHDIEGRTEIIDSMGHISNVKYDNRYLITQEIDPLGGKTLYEYDEAGRTTAVEDPDGNRTEYAYDELGNLLQLARPDGNTIATEFSDADKAMRITDPNGAAWQQDWDALGLLTRQVSPLGAESRYEYNAHGQLVGFINPLGARTALAFDTYGNLTRLTDALGHATAFGYDVLGNVIAKTDPLGQRTRYIYDLKGRLTESVLPSDATIACSYDHEDNLVRYVDENGAETRLEYFGIGEIKRRIQPDGHTVEYHYDTEERLIGVTNQRGETYELKRDSLGRIVEEVDYWGQARRYAYTAAGYLKKSADPLGRVIQYETDPLGRILNKLLPDSSNPEGLQTESFEYDANGNLIVCENASTRVERNFDPESRLLEERQGQDCIINNAYDLNGNRITRTTEVNFGERLYSNTVHYRYDALDQAVKVVVDGHAPLQLTRNALGQVTHETLSSGVRRDFEYSADGYLTAQRILATEGPLFEQSYQYDRAGNLVEKRDSVFGVDQYTYDPLGRFVSHLNPEGRLKRYLNDPAGDRLRTLVTRHPEDARGGAEWRRDGEYDGTYYRFDRAGNLIERIGPEGKTSFTWDANQCLIESRANGKITTYRYDPLGRRVSKKTEGVVTSFFWDGDALLGDTLTGGDEGRGPAQPHLREWVYYPETFKPLAMLQNHGASVSELYLYHNDPNGCPTRLLDAAGDVVWAGQYSAWGGVDRLNVNRVDNPIRLQGQYEDGETGLYYNRYRYYDAKTGSFVGQDPIRLVGSLNFYFYSFNAAAWIDPLGLTCKRTKLEGRITEPDLPPRTIVNADGVEIRHYTRSGDHGPAHLHVIGGGAETKIGQAGRPIKGSPALTAQQQAVVDANRATISKSVDQIQRWHRFENM